jgi:DNA-binding transcriptional regulator YiaG
MPKKYDIARLRRLLGEPGHPISQTELARRLGGVHQACVSRWESGVTKPPKMAVLLMNMLENETLNKMRAERAERRAARRSSASEGVIA